MKFILNFLIIISFLLSLTDEQKSRINQKTNDDLSAPNFTLKTIESRNFNDIKFYIKDIYDASKIFQQQNKIWPLKIQQLIDKNLLTESKTDNILLNEWEFILELSNDENEDKIIIANSLNENIKVTYDTVDDYFSFITPDENNLTIESSVTLDSLKGKVVLINFWATWCGPCRMEIPDFNELYRDYNDKGLEVLAISIDDGRDALLNFKNAYNIFYPILYGTRSQMSKIQMEYGGIYSIPITFLLNKKGEVIRVYPGAIIKQFDPGMYTDLVMNIENALLSK